MDTCAHAHTENGVGTSVNTVSCAASINQAVTHRRPFLPIRSLGNGSRDTSGFCLPNGGGRGLWAWAKSSASKTRWGMVTSLCCHCPPPLPLGFQESFFKGMLPPKTGRHPDPAPQAPYPCPFPFPQCPSPQLPRPCHPRGCIFRRLVVFVDANG